MYSTIFRHYYHYHANETRQLWQTATAHLSFDQLTQATSYSHGAIRDQFVHLISVDQTWFAGLRGLPIPEPLDPTAYNDAQSLEILWDQVEGEIQHYLDQLLDNQLFDQPFAEGEDQDLRVWQVILQVINHGTDHRAQILRQLHDLGVPTTSQDYIFYVYQHPV